MSTSLLDVQNKISEIENAIRQRDVNAGIAGYNALRIYSGDPSLDFQTKKLAHDKGIELYAILAQMRQEILQHEKIQESNVRVPQPTYADPMPLKGAIEPSGPKINFKTIILLIIILGFIGAGTYLFMTGDNSGGCSVDGPFACKETALKASASTNNLGQNYVILKLDPSKGIVSQINISNISSSLKGCDRVYIDRAYSLATNYEEVKIMFDCKNITLSEVAGAVILSYKLDGVDQTSTVRLSSVQSAIDTVIKDTLNINTTSNSTSPTPSTTPRTNTSNTNVSSNTTTNTSRTNTTSTGGYGGGGGGSGGGSGGSGYTIDETPPIMTLEVFSSATTLNSGGSTFNITFKSTGHANYLKNMDHIEFDIGGNTSTCINTSHLAVCYYVFPCPISWMGLNKTYSAQGFDDNDFDNTKSSTFIVPDIILPTTTISTSNATSFTSTPVNLTGTASDNYLLSLVEYRVNNGTWHSISGTPAVLVNWNISANIRNGSNYVEIRTTDSFSYTNTTIKSFNATLRPEINLMLYNNSNLNTTWNSTAYNGTVNLTDNTVTKDGPYAISFNGNETSILSFAMNNSNINNFDGYSNLSFWINGTNNTAMKIRVRGDADDGKYPDVNLTNLTGTWTLVQVNITDLNPNRQTINKIEFIPVSIPAGETNITFYIESLKLSGKISDVTVPGIGIIYPTNNSIINIALGFSKNITLRGNVTDDTYADYVQVQINNDTTIYNASAINFTTTLNFTSNWTQTVTLVNNTNIINITAYDIYGNFSGIYTINVTLNITSPTVTIIYPNSSTTQLSQITIPVNGTSSDGVNGSTINHTLIRVNSGAWQNTTGVLSWNGTVVLVNGSNLIEAMSVDHLGNNATIKDITVEYKLDWIKPIANITTSNSTNFTSTPVNISGNATDSYNVSYVEYRINNGTWHNATITTPAVNVNWSISANVRNGSNYLEIRTTDSYNNTNTTNKSFTATLRPEIDLVIYNNSDLNSNWTDVSYNGIVNLTDDTVTKDGPYTISFNGNETGALIINMTNNYTINNVDGYKNLSFWINGTNDTAMKIRIRGDANDSQFPDVNLTNLTGEWTLIEINMTDLNPYRYPINKIEFIPVSIPAGETNITIYIESLKLSGKITDVAGPQIEIIYPTNNTVINITIGANTKNITISGNVTDDSYMDRVTVQVNDNITIYNITQVNFTTTINVTYNWSGVITLVNDTDNIINITAYDIYGKSTIYTINVTLNITPDITAPSVALGAIGLLSGNQTNQTYVTINGTATEEVNGTGLNLTMWRMNYGPWQNISSASSWTQAILLINSTNFVESMSIDNSGNNATKNMTIYYNYSTMNATPLIIYDNDNFTSNWSYENASIGVNVTYNSTEIIYSGNSSIKVDSNAIGTLNIMIGNTTDIGVNTTNYTKVRFTIYANQSISNLNVTLGFVNDTNITYYGTSTFSIPAMNWTIVNASVSTLMSGNSTFNSLGLSISESTNVTYYLDNVQIIP